MTNNLDTLATALYVRTDDLLKESPHRAPWRPAVGIGPRISDAELVTLAVMQALLGFTSEARWLRHAHTHLRAMFPYLPGQSGYNKRLRAAREGVPWRAWGPYLSERQWGTVREDYSENEDAWSYLTHDQARSRP